MTSAKRDLMNYVEFLRDCGNLYLDIPETAGESMAPSSKTQRGAKAPLARTAAPTRMPEPDAPDTSTGQSDLFSPAAAQTVAEKPALSEAERRPILETGLASAAACKACTLCQTRTQVVYGTGSIMARIMFVGEAPGADEDRTGIPFVGRAGQLLTKMIEAAGFQRDEVYICNTLKCRPPDNRDPLPSEKEACERFLVEQIETIRPSIIVGLGAHAATYLTGQQTSIGKLRKKWHQHRGILLMATYHPAFLLRSPSFKEHAWEDLKMMAKKYNELFPDDARKIWQKKNG